MQQEYEFQIFSDTQKMESFVLPKFAAAHFLTPTKHLVTKENVQSSPSSSFSTAITMAAYITWRFSNIGPPGCPQNTRQFQKDETFPSEGLIYSVYLQPWCDYINSLHWNNQRGWVYKTHDTIHYLFEVTDEYVQKLLENDSECLEQKQLTDIPGPSKEKTKNIVIFNYSAAQTQSDIFKPKINLISLYTGIWFENKDNWRVCNIFKGELLTMEEFKNIDVIFLTGSSYSVNDDHQQVAASYKILNQALKQYPRLRVIGLCFGHQILGKYNNIQIIKHPLQNGIVKVNLQVKKVAQIFSDLPQYLLFAQYHSDSLKQVPKGYESIGSSSFCSVQAMISMNRQCLSFQCHPQYTIQYNRGFAKRVVNYSEQTILFNDFGLQIKEQYESKEGLEIHRQSVQAIRKGIRRLIDIQ